jgi:catechol 2,3-dioxygenase
LAVSKANNYFDMNRAPLRIAAVKLKVRDLDAVSDFYQRILGLAPLAKQGGSVTLGTNATPLLQLDGDPALAPRDPRQAGLFHTAFLLPSRTDLGRWLAHVVESRVPLQGASDHIVSEAIYLADPEGNGIEVYADSPVSRWYDANGDIHMATQPLDTQDLLNGAEGTAWAGFPQDGIIGHVHLQVGDTAEAERFYCDVLGFEVASRYPGASFFGSGGYHHQLAGNIWNSRGAGRRDLSMAGLAEIILRVAPSGRDALLQRTGGNERLTDPWGTAITLTS